MSSPVSRLKQTLWRAKRLSELKRAGVLPPEAAPEVQQQPRVLIGPANSAGQGYHWARALERSSPGLRVTSMQFMRTEAFHFAVDLAVPSGYGAHSRSWQQAQATALRNYEGVVIESGLPVLGGHGDGKTLTQIRRLQDTGVRVALLFHGSDIRDPDAHLEREPQSYFGEDEAFTAQMRERVARNRRLVEDAKVPVFVSTLDLLTEVPAATWLPVVVDVPAWRTSAAPLAHDGIPKVVHVPSSSLIKGRDLIEKHLNNLHDQGVIDYRTVSGVAHEEMPSIYSDADIVLDQFRGGPYGVAACEAMAAGRIVISHVPHRDRILSHTGEHVPIIEASHDTLTEILVNIAADPTQALEVAARGPGFVSRHHSGARSGGVLAEWLSNETHADQDFAAEDFGTPGGAR